MFTDTLFIYSVVIYMMHDARDYRHAYRCLSTLTTFELPPAYAMPRCYAMPVRICRRDIVLRYAIIIMLMMMPDAKDTPRVYLSMMPMT